MKKLFYIAVLALFAACTGNNGYTINGEIENTQDGDSIFLISMENRRMVKLDAAVIKDGKFMMKGVQDNPVVRYLVYKYQEDDGQMVEFFLENGNINIKMADDHSFMSGTPNNDAYQAVLTDSEEMQEQMSSIYDALASDEITDAQRETYTEQAEETMDKLLDITFNGIRKNIGNAAGIFLLKNYYYYMETPVLAEIVGMISEQTLANDEQLQRIKEQTNKLTATAAGQQFTDFELKDPDGRAVKLSDYAGKGKVVLVDFWASWCGPCRQEMPNVVKVYNQYKNKGLEIVGVSLDQNEEAWKKGIADLNMTWPQMSDLKYWQCEAASIYGVNAIPHTVLIGKDGTIIERNLRGDALYEKIAELLN